MEAGLPNVKGTQLASWTYMNYGGTGAFYNHKNVTSVYYGDGSNRAQFTTSDFDASRSSDIYRDDVTTVQPPALTARYYIKF